MPQDGSVAYVVECAGPDDVEIWLGDFLAEEIEPAVPPTGDL